MGSGVVALRLGLIIFCSSFFFESLICHHRLVFLARSTVFGGGRVMPIRRGGGVDQLDLIRFSRRLAAGWVNLSSSIMTRFKFKFKRSKIQIQIYFLLLLISSFAISLHPGHGATYSPRGKLVTNTIILLTSYGPFNLSLHYPVVV